jgi:hypothetical protein
MNASLNPQQVYRANLFKIQ